MICDVGCKMKKRNIALLTTLACIAGCSGCMYSQYQAAFGPGKTMDETARILVHDFKFGMRATQKAIQNGDDILPSIQKELEDYTILNGRNSFWIADVLGAIQTDRSRAMLTDLYSRTNAIARLTGAIGLARHKALPDPIDENSFLVHNVRTDPNQTETQLSIIALGWTKDEKALPCLLSLLKQRPIDYWHHAYACEALARIGSKQAIPILRDCLKSEQFYALPSAFRTLISLGDRDAVPLAIARVTPEIKDKNTGFIVRELKKVTGKSYGYDHDKWQKWWDSVRDKWQIPEEFTKPWDEQEEMY